MHASTEYPGVKRGDGYAVARLEDLGEGPGVRKMRKRRLRNVGSEAAAYACVGGNGGYVGRDGRVPEEDPGPRVRRSDPSG